MPRAKGYELGKSVFLPKLLQIRFPGWTRKETIQLCLTILHKIKYLNDRGIILGDINGQNILVVSPTEVYFVDCDSYQIGSYPCPAGTAHFTPPEAQGRSYETFLRTQAMENFAIATLLFMIMLPGKSPYSAVGGADPAENIRQGSFPYESDDNSKVPPGKWGFIWSHMSFNTRKAFVGTFRKGGDYFEPEKRMNADGWIEVFEKYWYGIDHMLKNDPMAMDLFPTRLKMRECKKCGKRYIPKPDRHVSLCDDCYGYSTAGRREFHEKWLGEVWKSYPCKNSKCHNTITLYNRDQSRYLNKRLPEYCQTCCQDQREQRLKQQRAAAQPSAPKEKRLKQQRAAPQPSVPKEKRLKQQRAAVQPSASKRKASYAPAPTKPQSKKDDGCLSGCSDGFIGWLLLLFVCLLIGSCTGSFG